ncbi:MAG: hypothetical protein E7668_00100 [Ruminococcaceae bacterium]|nr:hypothetical protein [Oscillospiraceae bacterium]
MKQRKEHEAMITFLFGAYGSGKTHAILDAIERDTQAGISCFLIVPEQETVQAEHAALRRLPSSAQLNLEVLNFSRLYNRVCREYGGLSYRYITPPIRHLLMWQNLRELAPLLEEYGTSATQDPSLCDILLAAQKECKASSISPDELETAASRLEENDPLRKRLRDLSLIFASFDRLVAEQYSDSADDLARLYEILQKERFFRNTRVYIDSFSSFTAVEHRIIERMFAQAEQVTVTVPLPHPECNDISAVGVRRSLEQLIRSAERNGGYSNKLLTHAHRFASPSLAYLSRQLWRTDAPPHSLPNDGSIRLELCDTPYAEAEAAAARVLELLRQGERCRDIVVLMRDPEQYRGILEPAFEKNDIPYFFSSKTDLCTLPPVKLLLSALRIKQYHWQRNDIISHVKTGLYDLPDRSVDLFEDYVDTWKLCGDRFTNGAWTMNPDGFAEELSERGKEILSAANEVREKLVGILERFFIRLEAATTVPEQCKAIYAYLTELDLEKRLEEMALTELERGNRKEAMELRGLFETILNTLADIAAALPEEELDTESLSAVLRMVFGKTQIGSIPTSVDEVMLGSAAMHRASDPKYVLILGLCEGSFPAAVNDTGLFSRGDRSALSALGIELSSDTDTRASDELMYVHRAFSAPSHGLFLYTCAAEASGKSRTPSLPFNRVRALFPDLIPHRYSGHDLRYSVGGPKSAVAHLRPLVQTAEGAALKEALKEHLPASLSLSVARSNDPICRVEPSLADSTVGRSIRFSSSRFETYVSCPFQYYCTYVLGLRERKKAAFRSSDMGSFIHYILEQLLRFAIQRDENGELPSDEELIRRAEKTVAEYIGRICPAELRSSKRLRHLYSRLKRLALLMVRNIVEEFSGSEFEPAFFELVTNGKDGNPSPMELLTETGGRITFSGIIDRVDVLHKNGETFLRVVDYKTGAKAFSAEDVRHGINIQMLLYLFTLCRNTNSDFAKRLSLADGQAPVPAGVIYLSAAIPVIQAEEYDREDAVLEKASDSLKRSGLLLNEEAILRAMSAELSPKFLAGIKKNKDGSLVGDALSDRARFDALYEQIKTTVETITEELRGGVADAAPNPHVKRDLCGTCKMKPICRRVEP